MFYSTRLSPRWIEHSIFHLTKHVYIVLGCKAYIFNRGVDAPNAHLSARTGVRLGRHDCQMTTQWVKFCPRVCAKPASNNRPQKIEFLTWSYRRTWNPSPNATIKRSKTTKNWANVRNISVNITTYIPSFGNFLIDSTRVNHARHRDAAPILLWM